jgi:hypothetical protein
MRLNKVSYMVLAIFVMAISVSPLMAANPHAEFDAHVKGALARFNREAVNAEGAVRLAGLVQNEYGTSKEELRWAIDHEFSWGQIVAFAYIQATNGRTFAELSGDNAVSDFWSYTEKVGMSSEKMARSLEQFSRRVERERNTRIFEQIRNTRTVARTPDLGSGFGLFQEALDFRRIDDAPRPTKVYTGAPIGLAKGDK